MQHGNIYECSGSWYIRYYNASGKRVSRRLGSVAEFPSKDVVAPLANDILETVNRYSVRSLGRFVEEAYLPHAGEHLRPSTCKGYRNLWRGCLSERCGGWPLRHTKTID